MLGLYAARFKVLWHAVLLSCLMNFGALAYFKYANFGLDTARRALELLGVRVELPWLDVLLPIGISFHVFQSFAYVMDVIHGRVACVPQLRPLRALRLLVPAARGRADRAAGAAHPAARHDRGAQGRLRVPAASRRGAVRGGLDPQGGRRRAVLDLELLLRRAGRRHERRGGVRDPGVRPADLRGLQRIQPHGAGD